VSHVVLLEGTVLEATQTVTGFEPEALLMTSVYDALFDEDLPGFLAVKTQFWDKGQSDVEVFIRRRSMEGEWIWLLSKAVSFIDNDEIRGIILEESLALDEEHASQVNRITRIAAILIQAVEAALLKESTSNQNDDTESASTEIDMRSKLHGNNDGKSYQAIIEKIADMGIQMPDNKDDLQHFIRMLSGDSQGSVTEYGLSKPEQEALFNIGGDQKKAFDPYSVIESVRQGVCLDLGLTKLYPDEVKLIVIVLSGMIPVDQVASLVRHSLQSGEGLRWLVGNFTFESEKVSSRHGNKSRLASNDFRQQFASPNQNVLSKPPPISVINLSYTYIGNSGIDLFSEILHKDSFLKTIDVSFCNIDEKGFLSLTRAIGKRKRQGMPPLKGVILSGNYISTRSAMEIGTALSPIEKEGKKKRARGKVRRTGYETDSAESDDDDDDEFFGSTGRNGQKQKKKKAVDSVQHKESGLKVLHVADSSMTAEALRFLLENLGTNNTVQEINLSSNNFGSAGAEVFVTVLEMKARSRTSNSVAMPYLDRLDMSNNNLGDEGTTQLTRVISKRADVHLVDLKLSSNSIGSVGIETIMNKLLQHSIISLSLDKNNIGDQGCQLVAASLQSMKSLSRLNLGFNQIGSRGIASLMRSLVACESMTYLGLSGNILRISGAISLAFALLQHPRLEELDLDNCCLGQAAQCHIVAGIISNRWVPMKNVKGYAVGPPMAAIGALEPHMAHLGNEDCLRIRKDEQMKTILQWMEDNRAAKVLGEEFMQNVAPLDSQNVRFLTPDYISSINDVHGTPSQNAYFRLLGWLSRIPFDESELTSLQNYFYDTGGGEGDRGSDGHINLKLRGDLLAALEGEAADEIHEFPMLGKIPKGSVGIDLDKLYGNTEWDYFEAMKGIRAETPPTYEDDDSESSDCTDEMNAEYIPGIKSKENSLHSMPGKVDSRHLADMEESESAVSVTGNDKRFGKVKPRITMFPLFDQQLAELKATATEMIEQEDDPVQHEIILTQYAEASLTILRQLRYHCMNSGLDGWRQGGLKRKVLIVDDSKVTRKLVSRAFEKANFIVDTASNGQEGVDKLKASLYDIAFMDIDMPVMNGFEATKKLREWEDAVRPGARQPICALTAAYVDDFERSELMKFKEAGLDVMESKPCNIPRLFKVVDDVSPMFSDLSITVMQKERSDQSLYSGQSY
jgi:CheY-like chemotaxis protein